MVRESYPILEGHLRAGRLDQAESVARHILGIEPKDMVARCAIARLTAAHGRPQLAHEQLRDLVAEAPRDALPLAYLAVIHLARGQTAEAREVAKRAAELGAQVAEIDVMLGDWAFEGGDLDDALARYEAALQRNPEDPAAWQGKGRVMRDLGELVMSEDALVHAVQFGPERVQAWVDLVKLEQDAGAHEVAAENLVLALKAHPGHQSLLALKATEQMGPGDAMQSGCVRIRQAIYEGRLDDALAILDELVEEMPDDPRLAIAKGEVCLATSKHQEVPALVHELNRLIRADPMAWEPKAVLGRLLLRESPLQNTRMAVAHAEEAFRISGEHPHAGIGLVEAWAATQKVAYARALLTRLAESPGPEAARAQAILAGRVA